MKGVLVIIRKTLIAFIIGAILIIFPIKNSSLQTVFQLNEHPTVITKGHYGYSYIVEISFTHPTLMPWLRQLTGPLPLLLLDAEWIKRSPNEVRFIKEKRFPVGLLGRTSEQYNDVNILFDEIQTFENVFSVKPLWYSTKDYIFPNHLLKYLFTQKINALASSFVLSNNEYKHPITKGTIVSIPFHEQSIVNIEKIDTFLKSYTFLSIEENIFGYTTKSKSLP